MALSFAKTIDLTAYDKNPEPKIVAQLSIIHEARDGEIVQYYVRSDNMTEEDKNSHAIGIYDKDKEIWSYTDYDELTWNAPGQRIAGNRLERLGVKAFPDVGAMAFYKLAFRDISRILAPVNPESGKLEAPALSVVKNENGTLTFTITPAENSKYRCYRIIVQDGAFSTDHITYDLVTTVDPPLVNGNYECFCIGFPDEGQYCSSDSNVVHVQITGKADNYESPFYTKDEVTAMQQRIEDTYTKGEVDGIQNRVEDTYTKEQIDQQIAEVMKNFNDGDVGEY